MPFTTQIINCPFALSVKSQISVAVYTQDLKVVRNSFPFSIPAELYERLTRL